MQQRDMVRGDVASALPAQMRASSHGCAWRRAGPWGCGRDWAVQQGWAGMDPLTRWRPGVQSQISGGGFLLRLRETLPQASLLASGGLQGPWRVAGCLLPASSRRLPSMHSSLCVHVFPLRKDVSHRDQGPPDDPLPQ